MTPRALALLAVLALVLLPALHAHGAFDGVCIACAKSGSLLADAGPAEARVVVPEVADRAVAAPAADPRPRRAVFRPTALSPPAAVA